MHTNNDNQINEPIDHREVDEVTQIKYFGGDHEYDGIKELDNPLPPWLKYLFYVTIIISFSYLVLVFVFKDDDIIQRKEYRKEMAMALAKTEGAAKTEAANTAAKPMTQEEILAAGKSVFDKNCVVCHGKFGEGLVGPNLTDAFWIHGQTPEQMRSIIQNGVLDKGMLSYKSQLSAKKIDQVIGYIVSIQGSNPPNAKAAQGVKN